jgi:putative ABC transport system ATP-binding protein
MLQVHGLHRSPLGPIDLEVAAGEILFVSGPSGSGKSLLLRSLADLDPHGGEIRLEGVSQSDIPPPLWRRRVAYLPSEPAWWAPRVGDLMPSSLDPDDLRALDLSPALLDSQPETISSGESQRLALLRLLQGRPRLLLLDEPSANLDPESTERLETLVKARLAAEGNAVIWVSHDRLQRERLADRHLELRGGRWSP